MHYITRDIEAEFLSYSSEFPIVLLTGMRQCGKSTMLAHIKEDERSIVSLDDLQNRELASSDPALFLQLHEPPLVIDEVQYAPKLFSYLKMHADAHPHAMGSIWLTGSQPFPLMKLAGESLAGRAGIVHMLPLSQHELYGSGKPVPLSFSVDGFKEKMQAQQSAQIAQTYERIYRGWMPAVANGRTKNVAHYYSSFVQTYLERDVRELDSAANVLQFSKFLRACAAQTARLLNLNSLAQDVGIKYKTAQYWLSILEQSDVVFMLHPYSNNLLKRAIKTPKLYFTDTGLAAWLGAWTSSQTLEAGALSGQIFENYVIAELKKTLTNSSSMATMWFYRDRDKKEIDALIEQNNTLHPIEIKRSAHPSRSDIAAFQTIKKASIPVGQGALVSMAQELGALDADCLTVPAWCL